MFIQIKMETSIAKLKMVGSKKIKADGHPIIKINKEIKQVTWIKTGIKILTGQNRLTKITTTGRKVTTGTTKLQRIKQEQPGIGHEEDKSF